ncbi:hypothetical protein Hamer_G002950 [Homarus americanus]|uniref:Uncharacterized protein n=1 Tax=Homarus americanus TaxID=6706 RepID=A0A8J5MUF1_HOMAM|nr:hypothetical protein Hamer_G002950 [Homarus americanus]
MGTEWMMMMMMMSWWKSTVRNCPLRELLELHKEQMRHWAGLTEVRERRTRKKHIIQPRSGIVLLLEQTVQAC